MNSFFSPLTNPFSRSTFWGREKELNIIWGRLLSQPPQSVVVIGEPYIGKSRLVKRLIEAPPLDEKGKEHRLTFVYLDCKRYIDLIEDWNTQTNTDSEQSIEQTRARDMDDFAAACFWWICTMLCQEVRREMSHSLNPGEMKIKPRGWTPRMKSVCH
jgi:hypothetical protein